MTREEAIDVLKHNYPSDCFTDLCEAVEIAIQALSAQRVDKYIYVPSTDTISIDVVGTDREKYSWGLKQIASDIKDIEELQLAQPEITEEQVREYCRKRGLIVIDSALLSKYVNGCQDMISGMPSAQPEIIRCRDCVYKPCKMMPYSYDDDFCSYAERREVSE